MKATNQEREAIRGAFDNGHAMMPFFKTGALSVSYCNKCDAEVSLNRKTGRVEGRATWSPCNRKSILNK